MAECLGYARGPLGRCKLCAMPEEHTNHGSEGVPPPVLVGGGGAVDVPPLGAHKTCRPSDPDDRVSSPANPTNAEIKAACAAEVDGLSVAQLACSLENAGTYCQYCGAGVTKEAMQCALKASMTGRADTATAAEIEQAQAAEERDHFAREEQERSSNRRLACKVLDLEAETVQLEHTQPSFAQLEELKVELAQTKRSLESHSDLANLAINERDAALTELTAVQRELAETQRKLASVS